MRPYFARALLRSEARLKAYYAFAPEAVRARLNRPFSLPQSSAQTGWYHLVKAEPDSRQHGTPDREYIAQLHVQYAEWYANVFKLELEENQWQQRLTKVADQRLILSESARRSFGAYSGRDSKLASQKGDFDDDMLSTLGLGGFPNDEEQALRSDCVKISLVKKIFKNANYLEEFWRWPVDQTAGFALGLELIFIGIFLIPITLWIGTGDSQVAERYIRDEANRLAAKVALWIGTVDWRAAGRYIGNAASRLAAEVRNFDTDKFTAGALAVLHAIRLRPRAFLMNFGQGTTSLADRWPVRAAVAAGEQAGRERNASLGSLAAAVFAELRAGTAAGGKRGVTWPRHPSPKSRRRS